GVVHPDKIRPNNGGHVGDKLLLTKPLGVGLTCTAARVGETGTLADAVRSMTTLNRYAAEAADRYEIHACTDVTGFGLAGHLHEMLRPDLSARIHADALPKLPGVRHFAEEFYLTAAAQRNRNAADGRVRFRGADFATEELVFDPQTSGGLLFAVAAADADALLRDVQALGLPCGVIGELMPRVDTEIIIEGTI
ncbi:MAG: selenide, water dikinase SelD, partial [Butyricicoccus sp.]|nr:selenide, water dikinase SelD [Butyricicoccus sp.]